MKYIFCFILNSAATVEINVEFLISFLHGIFFNLNMMTISLGSVAKFKNH